MSNFAWAKGPAGMALGGAAAAAVVVFGLYAAGVLSPDQTATAPDPAAAAKDTPQPTAPAAPDPIGESAAATDTPDPVAVAAGTEVPAATVPPDPVSDPVETPEQSTEAPVPEPSEPQDIGTLPRVLLDPPATAPGEPPELGLAALQAQVAPDPAPDPAAQIPAPTFDIVRVEEDGTALVAGLASAHSTVDIMLDGQAAGQGMADASGRFVSFLTLPPSTDARVLRLRMTTSDGTMMSDDEVILAPSAPVLAAAPEPRVAENTALTTPETVPQTPAPTVLAGSPAEPSQPALPEITESAPPIAQTSVPDPITRQPAPAQAVILSTAQGIAVLQTGAGARPSAATDVALDAIAYEDDGEVTITGRGTGTETVRIYLDNTPITSTRIEADGGWRAKLPDVDSGTYTLRVDELRPDGSVASRVESPFRREAPAVLAAAAALSGDATVRAVTVQPGNTLWAIARERFGEGTAYVRVFEANRDSIRNPDLIYPGQVFTLPDN